jgi:hypothetical protein
MEITMVKPSMLGIKNIKNMYEYDIYIYKQIRLTCIHLHTKQVDQGFPSKLIQLKIHRNVRQCKYVTEH